jgi:diacylglycerol O-acyltransferase / wax synthase
MTGLETLMWRLGRHDGRFNPTMSLVVSFDGPLRRSEVEARLAHLCTRVPRLRERVQAPALPHAPPSWAPDPCFGLDRHVSEERGDTWEVAARVVGTPFPADRPPWRAVVAGADGASLILHLHHSYTDGLGGMRLVAELFQFEPGRVPADVGPSGVGESRSGGPAGDRSGGPAAPAAPARPLARLVGEVGSEAARVWSVASRAVPWGARTMRGAVRDPSRFLASTTDLVDALRTTAAAAAGPSSPVLSTRSAGVSVLPVDLELEAFRRAARRWDATVNDVYVAGLLDGLERYHTKHGSVSPSLRMGLPISNRRSEALMQNQLFGAMIRGPMGRLDFEERVRLVHQIVLHGRNQPWADLMEDGASAAVRLPGMVAVVAQALTYLDVLASNVIGSPQPMWLGGRQVSTMTPVGPRTGAAVNATLLSYCGTASIGLNMDPAAVPDPGVLVDCVTAAFDDGLSK